MGPTVQPVNWNRLRRLRCRVLVVDCPLQGCDSHAAQGCCRKKVSASHDAPSPGNAPQKLILAPNCSLRGEFAMELKIPKLAESMFVPGAAKWTALLTLNASAWKEIRTRS